MFCGSKAHVLKECAPWNGVFVINPEIAFFRTDIVDYISPYFFSSGNFYRGSFPLLPLKWMAAHALALVWHVFLHLVCLMKTLALCVGCPTNQRPAQKASSERLDNLAGKNSRRQIVRSEVTARWPCVGVTC